MHRARINEKRRKKDHHKESNQSRIVTKATAMLLLVGVRFSVAPHPGTSGIKADRLDQVKLHEQRYSA